MSGRPGGSKRGGGLFKDNRRRLYLSQFFERRGGRGEIYGKAS